MINEIKLYFEKDLYLSINLNSECLFIFEIIEIVVKSDLYFFVEIEEEKCFFFVGFYDLGVFCLFSY